MSYHPDQEFCLVTFEEQENNPYFKGKGFWGFFSMTAEERTSFVQYKTVEKRNWIRRHEASQAILAAKRDRYRPVFYVVQKGEYFIFGVKGRRFRWDGVTAEQIVQGTYTDKIRAIVSNKISRKGNFQKIKDWRAVEKMARASKSEGRGGANSQRPRGKSDKGAA